MYIKYKSMKKSDSKFELLLLFRDILEFYIFHD